MHGGTTAACRRRIRNAGACLCAASILVGSFSISPTFAQVPNTPETTPSDLPDIESGEVAGGSGIGTSSLLVTSTQCFLSGCASEDVVLRYNGSTGAYLGVHIPSISDPWAMAIHPIRESLLVVSRSDSTVREYDAQTGTFVRVLVTPGAEGLNAPQGLALTPTGRLFVASNQVSGQLTKFNGILEFDSTTGAFVGNLVDGGSSVSETCSNPICLRGPNAMLAAPNGRLYVISAINDSVQEYTLSGTFLGAFTSVKLIGPSGLAMRPAGTAGAGNLLVSSQYVNPSNDFDDTIVEFSGVTRALVATNGGVFASGLIRPGPLAWHTDGNLLVGERFGEYQPLFADRVWKRNGTTGTSMGTFTTAGDSNAHQITALLHTHVNFATDDADADGDTDLKDLAAFQNCFPSSTTAQCLSPFDDNRTATIGRWDFLAFIGNFHGPRRPCTNATQCNDNDVCSVDQCVGGFCAYSSALDGTSCADSLFCDGAETCRSGVCRGKSPCIDEAHCNEATDACRQCLVNSECNDNNPCTDDTCTASFSCQFTAHTRTCSDGNPCTTNDRCSAGACVGGPPPNCNDNNVCSTDSCDPVLGCIHTDNLLPCDDGNACTLQDFCLQGTCRRGRDRDCEDGNACTNDSCNTNTGCVHSNNTNTCDDGDPCTVSDACSLGQCSGAPKNCSDAVACTVDRCLNGNCQNVADNSRCSNGNWCDGTEICNATLGCFPGTPPCEDNIPCTVDNCDPDAQSCGHTANHALCSNGSFCDGVEQCSLTNGCQPGSSPDCNDNVACTIDACDEQADNCRHDPDDLACEDNNVCTDNVCTGAGCQFPFNTDTCNDGLACTLNDICANGTCAGTPRTCPAGQQCDPADGQCKTCINNSQCNDNNVCTADTCNAGTCVFTPNTASCNDGLFCTLTDVCSGGVCGGSGVRCPGQLCNETTDACVQCLTASDCQDSNLCTDNVCNNGVCQFPANTLPCGDGLHCNGNEVCGGGSCQPGTPPNCSDGVPCTTDTCNESTDSCDHASNNNACNDGLFCNGVETCHITQGCVAGTPPVCSDGIPCTVDSCNVGTDACQFVPNNALCDDGLFCNGAETCSATQGCLPGTGPNCSGLTTQCANGVCNESTDACVAQPVTNGTACDDGLFCTFSESCQAGQCTGGTARTCDELDGPCVNGVCNESSDSCVSQPVPDNSPCDDTLFCTVNDRCLNGACSVSDPRDCSSFDEQCKDGVCNENTNACVAQPIANGTPCNDDLFCTATDQCNNGTCVGAGDQCTIAPNLLCNEDVDSCAECLVNSDCNDDNGCTDDTCVNGQCFQFTNGNLCDDGQFCTVNDHCLGGLCVGGGERCTTAPELYCNESADECVECLSVAECADDGNICTDTVCTNGVCGDVNNSASCDDGNFCTAIDSCTNGTCVGSGDPCPGQLCNEDTNTCVECLLATDCSEDSNVCTDRACVSGACQQVNNTAPCDDGSLCTINDACLDGVCGGDVACPGQMCNPSNGACVDCLAATDCPDDADVCTDRACNAGTCGQVNNTAPCDDGLLCTVNDSCLDGICDGDDACPGQMCNPSNGDCVDCLTADDCADDSNLCTDKACVLGTCEQVNNTASCDDGFFCTAVDACDSGTCIGSGDPCQINETCNEDTNGCDPIP